MTFFEYFWCSIFCVPFDVPLRVPLYRGLSSTVLHVILQDMVDASHWDLKGTYLHITLYKETTPEEVWVMRRRTKLEPLHLCSLGDMDRRLQQLQTFNKNLLKEKEYFIMEMSSPSLPVIYCVFLLW